MKRFSGPEWEEARAKFVLPPDRLGDLVAATYCCFLIGDGEDGEFLSREGLVALWSDLSPAECLEALLKLREALVRLELNEEWVRDVFIRQLRLSEGGT